MNIELTIASIMKQLPNLQRNFIQSTDAKEIEDIISTHALGAAAASVASGWLPAAGSAAAMAASIGFIWSMFYRINNRMGISISKNKLKSLASAIVADIAISAASYIAGLVASFALSFFPGVGSGAAAMIMAALNYGVVMTAGVMYLKLLTKLTAKGEINDVTEEELKRTASTVIHGEDVGALLKQAQKEYKAGVKNGSIARGKRAGA